MVYIASDDASYMPRELTDKFMTFIVRYCGRKSFIRRSYFIALCSQFHSIFVSNPTVIIIIIIVIIIIIIIVIIIIIIIATTV